MAPPLTAAPLDAPAAVSGGEAVEDELPELAGGAARWSDVERTDSSNRASSSSYLPAKYW